VTKEERLSRSAAEAYSGKETKANGYLGKKEKKGDWVGSKVHLSSLEQEGVGERLEGGGGPCSQRGWGSADRLRIRENAEE